MRDMYIGHMRMCVMRSCFKSARPACHTHSLCSPHTPIHTRAQIWRLFANFFYFGNFGIDFFFHMFFLVRYSRMLEEGSFRGRTADFLLLLFYGMFVMLVRLCVCVCVCVCVCQRERERERERESVRA